ncbi:hypothetical protein HDG38_003493 [Paraburkholderia sp. WSM4177]|nr:hypothetical protein [Paraburkholderia sp. WSM4177]MBB5483796.1 hypothetical protein [Paraburkholderia sp. WSM4180]
MHVAVRLFNLVEQHDRVRTSAHRFGQHAAIALLAAIERLRQCERSFRLADAGRPREQEDAKWLARVREPGARRLHALADLLQRVVLADHARGERGGQHLNGADLIGDHASDWNTGPVRDAFARPRSCEPCSARAATYLREHRRPHRPLPASQGNRREARLCVGTPTSEP